VTRSRKLAAGEFRKARHWQNKGWPVAVIARHLRRSPATIKAYLSGQRVPGPRAARADTFASFAGYSRRRLADDPHLTTRSLFREVAGLGYPGSYQSFCRALQRHHLQPGCQPCRAPSRPGVPPPPAGHSQHPGPLPIPASPVTGETLVSYLGRLAAANHLTTSDLLVILPAWFRTKISSHDDRGQHHMLAPAAAGALRRLAIATGMAPTALARALPAFGGGPPDPVRATTACRRCAATRGIHQPVPVHVPAHQQICTRHGIWLTGAGRPQLDLAACPEIIAAQHHARRLLRHGTAQQLIFAQLAAARRIASQPDHDTVSAVRSPQDRQRRARLLKASNPHTSSTAAQDELICAAIYPDAIALAATTLTGVSTHASPSQPRP